MRLTRSQLLAELNALQATEVTYQAGGRWVVGDVNATRSYSSRSGSGIEPRFAAPATAGMADLKRAARSFPGKGELNIAAAPGIPGIQIAFNNEDAVIRPPKVTEMQMPAPEWLDQRYDSPYVEIKSGVLHQLFRATAYAASTEESRFFLAAVNVEITGANLVVAATDGHRLATQSATGAAQWSPAAGRMLTFLLPAKLVTEFLFFCPETEAVRIYFGPALAVAAKLPKLGGSIFSMRWSEDQAGAGAIDFRVPEGPFPDYRRVATDKKVRVPVSLDRVAAIDFLDRAGKMKAKLVGLELRAGAFRIVAMPECTFSKTMDVDGGAGRSFQVCLDRRYLVEALRAIPGERIVVAVGTEEGTPVHVYLPGAVWLDAVTILMEVRA